MFALIKILIDPKRLMTMILDKIIGYKLRSLFKIISLAI